MITYKSQKQLKLEGFETPFEAKLDANKREERKKRLQSIIDIGLRKTEIKKNNATS